MTYTEWRDELKSNLLSVSEAERRRVLDYYAEAYADRREAGYTEREIIADFGAPYDAAQRILAERDDRYDESPRPSSAREERRESRRAEREERRRSSTVGSGRERREETDFFGDPGTDYSRERRSAPPPPAHSDNSWVFYLLCVIFAIPLFGVIMAMVGITVALCVSPFGLLIAGVATTGAGIGALFSDVLSGAVTIGCGLIIFGLSLIIMPLFFKLVKIMWVLFTKIMSGIKGLFSGRRAV